MRSTVLLAILLLSGCASHRTFVTLDTPLCPTARVDPAPAAVRIQIDAVAKTVTPKICHVDSGTEVAWIEASGKPFDAKFKTKSPDKWGKMKYDSKPVGSHQEAGFKAKKVDAQEAYEYDVTSNGITLDPTIIVDP